MKSRLFTCAVLVVLSVSQSCTQANHDGIMVDGIYVNGPYREGTKSKLVVRSRNPNFDCINLNGVNGSGEVLRNDGGDTPSLVKSGESYRRADILYSDNNPVEKLANIYNRSEAIIVDIKFRYVMFPIFNCKKFAENVPQHVYIYTLPSL